MPLRLIALDEWPDILVDMSMIVVGRHPACETRLDSIRVSRRHCCMTPVDGELDVKDLGSTNGIRINGRRVVMGRLHPGDELSIAHIRYKFDGRHAPFRRPRESVSRPPVDNPLAAIVRDIPHATEVDEYRIQIVVRMKPETARLQREQTQSQDHSRSNFTTCSRPTSSSCASSGPDFGAGDSSA